MAKRPSLFLIDGSNIQENLRGQPRQLYIEDAVQETTIVSAGVSAEFGRFTGGVVNAISRSGGNQLSGTFRDTLTNSNWAELTTYGRQHPGSETLADKAIHGSAIRSPLHRRHQNPHHPSQVFVRRRPELLNYRINTLD